MSASTAETRPARAGPETGAATDLRGFGLGWRISWPQVCLAAGLLAAAGWIWTVFLAYPGATEDAALRLSHGIPVEVWLLGVFAAVCAVALFRKEITLRRLRMAVEQTAENIVITDAAGRILYVNPAFERLSGYARAEVLGANSRVLKSGLTDPAVHRELWDTIQRGEVWTGRLVNRKKDGTVYHEDAVISPVLNARGRVVNYVGVKRDVTQALQMEAQFRQAQKMEAVGRLAGGVAHDFNNLLTVIGGHCELLLEDIGEDHPSRESVEEIRASADRAGRFTQQLLAFSRRQILDVRVIDLNEVVREMEKMIRRLLGEDVSLAIRVGDHPVHAMADRGQLEQILLNLVVNARDAMPGGGELQIRVAASAPDPDADAEGASALAGPAAVLEVEDTGCGMSEEVMQRLFEPFFTTKGHGSGTGLGLATCYGIVEQCGGAIAVRSRPGAGSRFRVSLPLVDQGPADEPPVESTSAHARGSETILLVEDDRSLRNLATKLLTHAGYTVLSAEDGDRAISCAASRNGSPLHLLLTDVVMPRMSGFELAERLSSHFDTMKVLFTSGHAEDALQRCGVVRDGVQFLQKPYSSCALLRHVRSTLDQPAGGLAPLSGANRCG
jgi:PAS domain S-box-containing protein